MRAYHTLVTGDSGGGKSTLLREMHDSYGGLSVWIDHVGVDGISGRDLDDAATVRSAAEARSTSATRLRWVTDDPLAAIDAARSVLHEYHEATGYPTQMIVDEAQDRALPDGVDSDNPTKQALHQDRDQGLKVVLSTQDPSDLDYTPLKQVENWTWVGEWSLFHKSFLDHWNIPRGKLPTERFRWVCFDKRMNVVEQGETKEVYG